MYTWIIELKGKDYENQSSGNIWGEGLGYYWDEMPAFWVSR